MVVNDSTDPAVYVLVTVKLGFSIMITISGVAVKSRPSAVTV